MTYVIGESCVDVLDRACVEECPVEAIYYEDDLPDKWQVYAGENARFFAGPLPGRDEPLGSPGGAGKVGVAGADTPFVAALPHRE
jgi:ferredoxin